MSDNKQNRHLPHDLAQMQSVSLEGKIIMTQLRIRAWYDNFDGQVYVSFSGGKDSTVLKHIVDQMYDDVPAVFVNTGLEYPEIQKFVREIKAGKYDCFNSDVEILRPEMRFDEVIKKYGYPVITKRTANTIHYAKKNIKAGKQTVRTMLLNGMGNMPSGAKSLFNCAKWKFLVDAPFDTHDKCCYVMKKDPINNYAEKTKRVPITAQMACESTQRRSQWIQYGCNAYGKKHPISNPMSFWTEQDVLHYIKKYNIPYCPVYGDIVIDDRSEDLLEGQINMIDYLGCYEQDDLLRTTGCDRTGCIFCMFGCHLEKEPNRFQRLKQTHPRQYEYCIEGGEFNDAGIWQPSKQGLGLGYVLDYIGVKYGEETMWKNTKIKGYDISAKVYGEGSKYGINGGKISKLHIRKENYCYLNYDRGWDIEPDENNSELLEVYNEVLKMWN